MEITEEIAEQYMKASNWTIKENDGRIEGDFDSPDGQRRGIMFQPFNGISVALFDFNAKSIPSGPTSSDCGYSCQFNYCICGRIECVLDDNSYFYMTENELSVTCQNPGDEFFFPTNRYQGIDIFFNTDALAETQDPVLRSFELDFSKIPVLYFGKRNTFTAEANSKLKAVMEKLWSLYDDFSPFYARLYTLEFLHLFLSDKACIERPTVRFRYRRRQPRCRQTSDQRYENHRRRYTRYFSTCRCCAVLFRWTRRLLPCRR